MPHIPDSWLDAVTLGDVVGALLALGLIGGIVIGAVKLSPILARITRVIDLILGRPAEQGIPAQPSMIDRLEAQDQQIAEIQKQVTPNHGSSAHDQLTKRIGRVDSKVDVLFQHLGIEIPPDDDPDT